MATDAENLEALKAANIARALGPKKVATALATVEMDPIPDGLAAEDKLAKNIAIKKPHRGMRLTKLVPPGAT